MINSSKIANYLAAFISSFGLFSLQIFLPKFFDYIYYYDEVSAILNIVFLGMSTGCLGAYFFKKKSPGIFIFCASIMLLFFLLVIHFSIEKWLVSIMAMFIFALLTTSLLLCFKNGNVYKVLISDLLGGSAGLILANWLIVLIGAENFILVFVVLLLLGSILVNYTKVRLKILFLLPVALFLGWNVFTGKFNFIFYLGDFTPGVSKSYYAQDVLRDGNSRLIFSQWSHLARVDVVDFKDYLNFYFNNRLWTTYKKSQASNGRKLTPNIFLGKKIYLVGVGGGEDIKDIKNLGVKEIVSVEMNDGLYHLMTNQLSDLTGNIYKNEKVAYGEGRSYLRKMDSNFDVIYFPFSNSYHSNWQISLNQDHYLFTREALNMYLEKISESGYLLIKEAIPGNLFFVNGILNTLNYVHKVKNASPLLQHITILVRKYPDLEKYALVILYKKSVLKNADIVKIKNSFHDYQTLYDNISGTNRAIFLNNKLLVDQVDLKNFSSSRNIFTDDRPNSITPDMLDYVVNKYIINYELLPMILFLLGVYFFLFLRKFHMHDLYENMSFPYAVMSFILAASLGFNYGVIESAFIQKMILVVGMPIGAFSAVILGLVFGGVLGSLFAMRFSMKWNILLYSQLFIYVPLVFFLFLDSTSGIISTWPARAIMGGVFMIPLGMMITSAYAKLLNAMLQIDEQFLYLIYGFNALALVFGIIGSKIIALLYGNTMNIVSILITYLLIGIFCVLAKYLCPVRVN